MSAVRLLDVERKIVEQHEEIRARIHGLTNTAERSDLSWARRALRIQVLRFAADFDAHLDFEERELGPWIRELDAWGQVRESALLAEHREQRCRLQQVCTLAEDPSASEATALSDAVLELADGLLEDMLHEERVLAELAWIDENGHPDQMTG